MGIASNSVLVLDDDSDIVIVFKKSLELGGYSVFGFTDPELALEHFKNNSNEYSLIISDVRMPKMDGIQFARHARSTSPNVKIVLMSAFNIKEMEMAQALQIAELLEKPVTSDQLKALVSRHLVTA